MGATRLPIFQIQCTHFISQCFYFIVCTINIYMRVKKTNINTIKFNSVYFEQQPSYSALYQKKWVAQNQVLFLQCLARWHCAVWENYFLSYR